MLSALLPPLIRQLHLPDASIGWIFSLSALLWVLTSPYWGRLSNRAGRKPVIASGLLAFAISMGSFALVVVAGLNGLIAGAPLFASLVLTRAIFGAFGSASSPAAQAYIADRTSLSERTEQLAKLTAALAVGQAFGPGLCAMLAARTGMVFPLLLAAAFAGIGAFCIWRFLSEDLKPVVSAPAREGPWASLDLARDPRLAGYLIFGFGMSIVTGTLQQIYTLYVMDTLNIHGSTGAETAATGFMIYAITLLLTQLAILPRIKLGPRALMAWGATIVSAGVAMQMMAGSLGGLLVSQVMQGLGFGLARPGFTGGASMAVRSDEQGASAGLVVAVNGAGFVFSPMTGAVAYQQFGMNAPLWIALGLLLAMLLFVVRSRRLKQNVLEATTVLGEP